MFEVDVKKRDGGMEGRRRGGGGEEKEGTSSGLGF